ncbi:hypothetical protein CAEBREN_31694 [Caenorhabditis brenneri]|uniref:Uncharacterized protein n=1 Tax=Caenorhabditis brenneri TaxID=135651 RepID=G0N8N3_CAEBE|nr:hypothetical protein CAEBREN_31694 [Caenorhabditis brenneri]
MDFWYYLLGFDYLVSTIGLIANLLYFRNVVMNKFYDGYWRVASFIVSTGMITLIVSHIAMSLICLAYDGSIYSSRHCGKNQRYGAVFLPVFRLTFKYKLCFFTLILAYLAGSICFINLMRFSFSATSQLSGHAILTLLYVLSFFFVIHLHFFSKKQYYKTIGEIPLEQRYLVK